MNGLTVLSVLLLAGIAASATIESRIVGGVDATAGQFPHLASLRRANGNHFCGASILNTEWLLSAAHCTESFANNGITVVVGSHLLNTGGFRHQSNLIINHPQYNINDLLENDISLIRVATPFVFSNLVQPIFVGSAHIGGGIAATVSGWGLLSHQGVLPNTMQTLATSTITNEQCRERHLIINRRFVHDNVICTQNPEGQGMCSGDSGGSLVAGNFLIGIPSWVIPCARGRPDAYARVSSHNQWIFQHIPAQNH